VLPDFFAITNPGSHPYRATHFPCHGGTLLKTTSPLAVVFEILNGPLVLLGLIARCKRSQIAPLAGLWIHFPGIQSILARLEFSDHGLLPNNELALNVSSVSMSNSRANQVACRLRLAFLVAIREIRVTQRMIDVIPH
jgi:hypothetical protein